MSEQSLATFPILLMSGVINFLDPTMKGVPESTTPLAPLNPRDVTLTVTSSRLISQ